MSTLSDIRIRIRSLHLADERSILAQLADEKRVAEEALMVAKKKKVSAEPEPISLFKRQKFNGLVILTL